MIIYNENNNRCCALVQIQKKKRLKTPEVSAQTLQASRLELQFFCRISHSYSSKVSPEGQRTLFGKLTGTSPLLTSTKTEQSTWRLRVICVKLPTTAHMLPSRRPKSFQPDKKQPLTPITQQQSRQSSVSLYSPSARLTSCSSSWEEHTGAPTAPDQHRRLWPTFKLGPSALNNVYWKVLWKHSDRHAVMCPPTSEPNKKKLKKKKNEISKDFSTSDVWDLWWEPYRLNSSQRSPRPPRQTYNVVSAVLSVALLDQKNLLKTNFVYLFHFS